MKKVADYRLPQLIESDVELNIPEIVPDIDLDVPDVDVDLKIT